VARLTVQDRELKRLQAAAKLHPWRGAGGVLASLRIPNPYRFVFILLWLRGR
jgi:hypothetical protein